MSSTDTDWYRVSRSLWKSASWRRNYCLSWQGRVCQALCQRCAWGFWFNLGILSFTLLIFADFDGDEATSFLDVAALQDLAKSALTANLLNDVSVQELLADMSIVRSIMLLTYVWDSIRTNCVHCFNLMDFSKLISCQLISVSLNSLWWTHAD